MTQKRSESLTSRQAPGPCPICGKVSYSAAGIHPQCAVQQADEKRRLTLKQNRLAEDKTKTPKDVSKRWQKTCPKCKLSQHVRKKSCVCGHNFSDSSGPPKIESE